MIYETTYTYDELSGSAYFTTVDDAADIAAAFMEGETVIFHLPRNEEAVSEYRFFEAYIKLINYQVGRNVEQSVENYNGGEYIFTDSVVNNLDTIYVSLNKITTLNVMGDKLRIYIDTDSTPEEYAEE